MKKEKRDDKVQIRISDSDRKMLEQLMEKEPVLNISLLFRNALYEACRKHGINEGIGSLTIG